MRPPAPDHVAEVASGLAAVEVRPPDGYAWMGQAFDLPAEVVRLAGGDALRDALIDGIRWRLYSCFFTTGGPRPAPPPSGYPAEWRALSHELAAANCGTGCVDPGWRLIDEDDGRYVVERRALRLWVRPDEITPTEGGTLTPGETVAIRLPSDVPEFSPGFYMALGDQGFSADIPRALDRFYLNLRREGAVEFVRETTRRLNRAGLAFRAKVADEPQGFGRRDWRSSRSSGAIGRAASRLPWNCGARSRASSTMGRRRSPVRSRRASRSPRTPRATRASARSAAGS